MACSSTWNPVNIILMESQFPRPKAPSFARLMEDYGGTDSLLQIVSPDLQKQIALMIKEAPELVDASEEFLTDRIKDPSATTSQLRSAFWTEYERAVDNRTRMDLSRVYTGIMTRQGFMKHVSSRNNLAWILCMPKLYELQIEEMLHYGLRQVRQILEVPIKNDLGYCDPRLMDVKLKAVAMLDMRLKGGYIQRSMQLNKNINENRTITDHPQTPESAAELDQRIQELEARIKEHSQKQLEELKTPTIPSPQAQNIQPVLERTNLARRFDNQSAVEAEFKELED